MTSFFFILPGVCFVFSSANFFFCDLSHFFFFLAVSADCQRRRGQRLMAE